VLIENSGREKLTALLPKGADNGDVRLRWLACRVVQQFERGKISRDEFAAALVEEWGIDLAPADFLASFAQWPNTFFPGARELVADLRRHHRVSCLSNSNEVHWERFPELDTLFEHALSSHRIGHVKPDREAFEHALQRTGARPRDTWFFDDLEPNVAAARAVGMRAVQVDGLAAVREVLAMEGLA
jgi:glucose-1-phosphatase